MLSWSCTDSCEVKTAGIGLVFGRNGCKKSHEMLVDTAARKGMRLAFLWTLTLLAGCIPARCDSNAEKIADLVKLRDQVSDGVIRLDDISIERFIVQPEGRPYCLVIFFDAVQMHVQAELKLEELRQEFGLVAMAFLKESQGQKSASKLFFVELELGRAQRAFDLFGVKELPLILLLPPGLGSVENSHKLSLAELSQGAAEGIAAFVEQKSSHKVGSIERPPFVSRQQIVVMAAGLALAAPFVVKFLMSGDTPFHEKGLWCTMALVIYIFSVSGGMFNMIRDMPFFIEDTDSLGNRIFFYPRPGMQLGAESVVVGFLYTIVGIIMAVMSHFLVRLPSLTMQRFLMLAGLVISFWAVRSVYALDSWKRTVS